MLRVMYTHIVGEYGQAVTVIACNKMDVIVGWTNFMKKN